MRSVGIHVDQKFTSRSRSHANRVSHSPWERSMSTTYVGAPPPASSLGAWLLRKVEELADLVGSLVVGQSAQKAAIDQLNTAVAELKKAAEKSAKVQSAHGQELEEVKSELRE